MKLIREVVDGDQKIVIFKKFFVYRIEFYGFQEATKVLKCSIGKGRDPGVFHYYPKKDLTIGAIADFTLEKELLISINNGPQIIMNY
tara:strand:+ start:5332 stop:5592 length:261 start_codon:yes stop_codon:yes gene_type:complete